MDKENQELIGKMALLAFVIIILVSIIINYACVFMSSTNEIVQNQERHVGFNPFSGIQIRKEQRTTGSCS